MSRALSHLLPLFLLLSLSCSASLYKSIANRIQKKPTDSLWDRIEECTAAFYGTYSSMYPLSTTGRVGDIFLVKPKKSHQKLIMKAIPKRHENLHTRVFSQLMQIRPENEVRIAESLSQMPGGSSYMFSVDWFECSLDAMVWHFGPKNSETKPRKAWKIDTIFLVAESIQGMTVRDAMYDLARNDLLSADFILGVTYMTVNALKEAHTRRLFSHNDLHTSNVILENFSDASVCKREHNGWWRFPTASIPRGHTCGSRPKIIDFGTSFAKVANSSSLLGSSFHRKLFQESSTVSNLRLFLGTMVSGIPKSFFQKWSRSNFEQYQSFNNLFQRIFGLSSSKSVTSYGVPDWLYKSKTFFGFWWRAASYWHNLRQVFLDVRGVSKIKLSYDDVLSLPVFKGYRLSAPKAKQH